MMSPDKSEAISVGGDDDDAPEPDLSVARRRGTRQEEEAEEQEEERPEPMTLEEELGSAVVGFVPIIGPLVVSCWHASKRRLIPASIYLASCLIDVVTWGGSSWVRGTQVVAKTHKVGTDTVGYIVATKGDEVVRYAMTFAPGASSSAIASAMLKAKKMCVHLVEGHAVKQFTQTMLQRGVHSAVAQRLSSEMIKDPEAFEGELADVAQNEIEGTVQSPPLTAAQASGEVLVPQKMIPLRPLSESNFLALYNKCARRPMKRDIIAPMTTSVQDAFKGCVNKQDEEVNAACARLWTQKLVYKAVNAALITDNAGLLQHWMPFIRSLNRYLVGHRPDADCITRRKSFLSPAQVKDMQKGHCYRLGMYVSSSKQTWDEFPDGVGGGDVRIEFDIPKHCFQASDVEGLSAFEREREILFVPYTPVRVTKICKEDENKPITIHMQVLKDSRDEPLDLETILA